MADDKEIIQPHEDLPGASGLVQGWQTTLTDGRAVFLGRLEGHDQYCLKFVNKGIETRLGLSGEAMRELVQIYQDRFAPNSTRGLLHKWTMILSLGDFGMESKPSDEWESAS